MQQYIIAFIFAAIVITGCNNETEKPAEQSAKATDSVMKSLPNQKKDSLLTNLPIGDNSYNSLDWPGNYKGIVPCADCEGIETTIILGKDLFYSITTKHLGKNATIENEKKGEFTWNSEGSKITLTGLENAPCQYLVGENMLIQLDMNGNRITGEIAVKYQLRKTGK